MYGRLKGRWRCLLKWLDVDVGDVPELVTACCILHNICEVHGEDFNDDWLEGVESQVSSSGIAGPSQSQDSAVGIRDALKSHFTT